MEVTTNGTLLTPKIVDAILPILDTIGISFDGATKETFEHIREGARFERVVGNVRYLVERARQMPEANRPRIGLAATIMERNVRELAALVALEHELGLDFLSVTHVFPATEEMRKQSLFHHQELAKKHLAEAEALARRLGVALLIGPLDQIIATTATNGERTVSLQDGVVPGFEEKKINWTLDEPRPASQARGADAGAIAERRAGREAASPLKKRRARRHFPKRDAPIWVCDYLWNKTYVHVEGEVRPCCVVGPPVLGNLETQSFTEIWDGPAYRAMRQHLAARSPVGVCKGCQFIREVGDPKRADELLQGMSAPRPDELLPIPPELLATPAPILSGS
jgi:radical SAM protein with 4Fe4S-binding SPASM domain